MITAPSAGDFSQTMSRLTAAIAGHGLEVFAQVDHAAGARSVGLEMPPEVVVMFGNPRAGTPLMRSDPRVGIELPLKMLVWDSGGTTMVGYHDPRDLAGSYAVEQQAVTLEAMAKLLAGLAQQATA